MFVEYLAFPGFCNQLVFTVSQLRPVKPSKMNCCLQPLLDVCLAEEHQTYHVILMIEVTHQNTPIVSVLLFRMEMNRPLLKFSFSFTGQDRRPQCNLTSKF